MVQINNQAVIQKLIDELKLYPGTGMIPTELADKILPVFQINSEELTITTTPCNIVRSNDGDVAQSNTKTLYTTPATGEFFLTSATLNVSTATAGGLNYQSINIVIDGVTQKPLLIMQANEVSGTNITQTLSFPNPLKLDAGSIVSVTSDNNAYVVGTITGYTSV